MKKISILMLLLVLLSPLFAQGTMEVVAEKGIIGAYKSLINYKEGVYVPEEEKKEEVTATVAEPLEEVKPQAVLKIEEKVETNEHLSSLPENGVVITVEVKGGNVEVSSQKVGIIEENEVGDSTLTRFDAAVLELSESHSDVYEVDFDYNGVITRGIFTCNAAVLEIPSGVTGESIDAFARYLLGIYPDLSEVTYSFVDDMLFVYYPEKTMEEIVAFTSLLSIESEKFIDSLTQSSSVILTVREDFASFDDVVMYLSSNQTDVYEVGFDHNGVETQCAFTKNKAVLMIPSGVTDELINEFAEYLLKNYPEFENVYFSRDFDRLTLTYPEKSIEEIIAFSSLISSEAEKFIDMILSRAYSTEDGSEETDEIDSESNVDLVAPVAAPVAVPAKKSIFTYSAGFDIGMQGLFTSDKNAVKFFPTIGGEMRLYAWKFIFLESGGDLLIYKNSSKLIVNGALRAVAGVSLMGNNFGVVAYGGAIYLFTSENSVFNSGYSLLYGVGLEFNFAGHIALKAGYEHYDNKNLYNVSVGYRF